MGRPSGSNLPYVHGIAHYLRQRSNQEIPRRVVGREFGLNSSRIPSVLTAVTELYPQIGESDDCKLIWTDWDALS